MVTGVSSALAVHLHGRAEVPSHGGAAGIGQAAGKIDQREGGRGIHARQCGVIRKRLEAVADGRCRGGQSTNLKLKAPTR